MTAPGRCHLVQLGCTRPALQAVYAGPLFGVTPMCATHLEDFIRRTCQYRESVSHDPDDRLPYLAACAALNLPPRPWWGSTSL